MRPQKAGTRQIRILISDNHPVFYEGVRRLLETEPDFAVVGHADDGAQAFRLTMELRPDVLLLDAHMPGVSGLEVTRRFANIQTNTKIILLTAGIEHSDLARAIQLGIRGVVLKQSATQNLYAGIRAVVAGNYWMISEIVPHLGATLGASFLTSRDKHTLPKDLGLTPRELEIVNAVLSGKTQKDIAAEFSISELAVKHHLNRIFKKVGVSDSMQLMLRFHWLRP